MISIFKMLLRVLLLLSGGVLVLSGGLCAVTGLGGSWPISLMGILGLTIGVVAVRFALRSSKPAEDTADAKSNEGNAQ